MDQISTAGVVRKGGKYLLALRKPGSSIGESWEFPGGKVQEGESPEAALEREFYEELQVHIIVGKEICSAVFSNRGVQYALKAFDVKLLERGFTLAEHQETGWFSIQEMIRLPMADSDRSILEWLRSSVPGTRE
jgi:8-oxo-dGTP diphosphatase